jgi:MYXO-CTERM domain-containing protein
MKSIPVLTALLAAIFPGGLSAATVLVGGSVNNGNFNDNSLSAAAGERTFANTLFWDKLDAGTYVQATTDALIGGLTDRNHFVRRSSTAAGYSIAAGNTGHTIATGDVYDVAYTWVDGSGWADADDQITIRLFTTSDDTLAGVVTYIATINSGVKGATSGPTSQFVDQNAFFTATAAEAGKTLFVAITSVGTSTNAFGRVDDFSLEVTAVPEPAAALLGGLGMLALVRRRR